MGYPRRGWRLTGLAGLAGLAVLTTLVLLAAPLAARAQALVIACEDYPPYEYLEDGQPRGLCVEMVQEACQRLGLEPEFRFMPWSQALDQARAGQVQAIMSLFRTPEREQFLVFPARQLAEERVTALVRKGSGVRVRGLTDLARLRVGVNIGYAYGPVIDGIQGIQKIEAADPAALLQDLLAGRTEVALGNELTLNHVARRLKCSHALEHQRTLASSPQFIAFARARGPQAQELADSFDRVLKDLNDEGVAARIRAQY